MACQDLQAPEYKRTILAEFSLTENAEAATQLDFLWTLHSPLASPDPRLRVLFVRRDFLRYLIGQALDLVDWKWEDVAQSNNQAVKNRFELWKLLLEEIKAYRAGRAIVGAITATEPRLPQSWEPDAGAYALRGDAIERFYRRRMSLL